MILTEAEVVSLTHKVRPTAQAKALASMGIDHRIRPDGTVMVLHEHLISVGKPTKVRSRQPNWGALDAENAPATK